MFEINALFKKEKREIKIGDGIQSYYQMWKQMSEEMGQKNCDLESFVAGYMVGTNTILREKFIRQKYINKKIEETFK